MPHIFNYEPARPACQAKQGKRAESIEARVFEGKQCNTGPARLDFITALWWYDPWNVRTSMKKHHVVFSFSLCMSLLATAALFPFLASCRTLRSCKAGSFLDVYKTEPTMDCPEKCPDPWRNCVDEFKACSKKGRLPKEQEARMLLCTGLVHTQKREAEEALPFFLKAKSLAPDQALVYHFLTYTYIALGRLDEAARSAIQEVTLEPDWKWGYMDLGAAYMHAGRYIEAETALRMYLEKDPENAMVHRLLSMTLSHLDAYDEAIDEIKEATRLDPQEPMYALELFDFLANMNEAVKEAGEDPGLLQDEKEAGDKLVQMLGDDMDVLLSVARSRMRMGNYEGAFELLQKAEKIDPGNPEVIEGLILACGELGNCIEVEEIAEHMEKVGAKETSEMLLSLGLHLKSQDKLVDAEKFLRKAMEADPGNADIHSFLSQVLSLSCRLEEALGEAKTASSLSPQSELALATEALTLSEADRYSDALNVAQKLIETAPSSPAGYFLRSIVRYYQGDLEEAASDIRKAIGIDDSPIFHDALAEYLLAGPGSIDEAGKEADLFCKSDPDDALCVCLQGVVKVRKGQAAEGLEQIRKAEEMEPDRASIKIYLAGALAGSKEKKQESLKEAQEKFLEAIALSPPLAKKFWVVKIQDSIPKLKGKNLNVTPFDDCKNK
jgi:tetratricopeptide (TPR) repeat protein